MSNQPIIIWEKWRDPLGSDEEEPNPPPPQEDFEEDLDDEDIIDGMIKSSYKYKEMGPKCKMIITPFGMIPYNEHTASGKIFNFWTGHSNFAITQNISNIIESIEGVETLDIFTKYRFRIAIAKAFQDSEIMREINSNIYKYLEQ
jgi:hypothetical protein